MLRRCSRIERSPVAWAWLMRPQARANRAKTLGTERFLLGGTLWRGMLEAVKRLRLPPPPPERETLSTMLKLPLASEPLRATRLHEMIAPLRLDVSEGAPRRVNIVIPTLDLGHFFGGYIAKFNLGPQAGRVRHAGANGRWSTSPSTCHRTGARRSRASRDWLASST